LGVTTGTAEKALNLLTPLMQTLGDASAANDDPEPIPVLVLPAELHDALNELVDRERSVLEEVVFHGKGYDDFGLAPGTARQQYFRAVDKFYALTVRNVVTARLGREEQARLVSRYRDGGHWREPEPIERSALTRLMQRLREIGLSRAMFPAPAGAAVSRRYESGQSAFDVATSMSWSVSRYRSLEFAHMRNVVTAIDGITLLEELPHAVPPPQREAVQNHFVLGHPEDQMVRDAMESLAWLFTHSRYLNFGRYPPTSASDRELLAAVYVGGQTPTAEQRDRLRGIVDRVIGVNTGAR
jgi:hypothetical protein